MGSKFEVGKTYAGRHTGDSNSIGYVTVAKRTDKTITTSEGKRLKIHHDEQDGEFVYPDGKFSMALIIRAKRDAESYPAKAKPAPVTAEDAENVTQTAALWSVIACEPVNVWLNLSGALETRGASEAACKALQAAIPSGRVYHTVNLGWRFVVAQDTGAANSDGVRRVESDWRKIAGGQPVQVELVRGTFYGFTTELGALRLFHKYNKVGRAHSTRAAYSENLGTWFFALETYL